MRHEVLRLLECSICDLYPGRPGFQQRRDDSPGRAAGAEDQDRGILEFEFEIIVQIPDQADAVGVVSGQFPILHFDGIDGA